MISTPNHSTRSAMRLLLAGQSNMQGQGNITPSTTPGTPEYIVANDPGSDYQFLVDGGGDWVLRDDVWIKDGDDQFGGLTAGYGSNSGTVGPELGFAGPWGKTQRDPIAERTFGGYIAAAGRRRTHQ